MFLSVSLHSEWPDTRGACRHRFNVSPSEKTTKWTLNQQTTGSKCARTIDVMSHWTGTYTTTETRVAYDTSTWHAIDTGYINSTKETHPRWLVSNRLPASVDLKQHDIINTSSRWSLVLVRWTLRRDGAIYLFISELRSYGCPKHIVIHRSNL